MSQLVPCLTGTWLDIKILLENMIMRSSGALAHYNTIDMFLDKTVCPECFTRTGDDVVTTKYSDILCHTRPQPIVSYISFINSSQHIRYIVYYASFLYIYASKIF